MSIQLCHEAVGKPARALPAPQLLEQLETFMDNKHGHSMDRELVSEQPHELEYLARTHGASVSEVQAVIKEVGSRSRRLIEQELDKRYQHRPRSSSHKTDPGNDGTGRPQ
jgi:hypothetical protein